MTERMVPWKNATETSNTISTFTTGPLVAAKEITNLITFSGGVAAK